MLMDFLAERQKVFIPTHASAEIGILGIELKLDVMSQAIEHGIHHIIHFDEEAAVYPDAVDHAAGEGFVDLLIGC